METYETISAGTKYVHKLLANAFGEAGLISDTPEQAHFFIITDKTNLFVRYFHGVQVYELQKANDEGEPIGANSVVINSLFVADLFTVRRLKAAIEVLR